MSTDGKTGNLKIGGFVIAMIMMLIASGGVLFSLATKLTSKADRTELYEVQQDIYRVNTAVEVIKTEQRMLIRRIDPTLPVGNQ